MNTYKVIATNNGKPWKRVYTCERQEDAEQLALADLGENGTLGSVIFQNYAETPARLTAAQLLALPVMRGGMGMFDTVRVFNGARLYVSETGLITVDVPRVTQKRSWAELDFTTVDEYEVEWSEDDEITMANQALSARPRK